MCGNFLAVNIAGVADTFRLSSKDGKEGGGESVLGKYFGQSSFAKLSVVSEAAVLPAKDLIKSEEELKLFAPLGCGIQTGAGAVLNTGRARKEDTVMVLGLGGVGLAGLMVRFLHPFSSFARVCSVD
jgi:Zn-dependent alcohol dehydrogenase